MRVRGNGERERVGTEKSVRDRAIVRESKGPKKSVRDRVMVSERDRKGALATK